MQNALVTGGAGFIGSHLARRLLSEGWRVFIVDNLSTGLKVNIPKGAEFIFLDISKDLFIDALPKDALDAVFHLAAQSSGEISFDDPEYDLKTNCLSTLKLLDWCYKKRIPRFVFTSSMSIYGDQETQPVSENVLLRPKSYYGVGKLASEQYVNLYAARGLRTSSLRLFNVYGPGQNMENLRQGMVSIYMAYIAKNQPIEVRGSADRYRDFIYIDDVVEAYMRCLWEPRTYGKSYNVATGIKTTVRELLYLELKSFGLDPTTYKIHFGVPTPGDTFGIFADISAIRKDTGWEPRVSLESGLRKMAEWVSSLRR